MRKFQENLKTERTHSLMQKKNSVSVPNKNLEIVREYQKKSAIKLSIKVLL